LSQQRTGRISHALWNIKRYKKYYGISKAIRVIFHYMYVAIKKKNRKKSGELIVDVNGYKLAVIPGDLGISSELLMFKTHEPLTTKFLSNELKKGMTCLDVGGNIGYYTLLESKIIGNDGKVIAIEPSPPNFQHLKKNLEIQDAKNVVAYNFAAGDVDGNVNFLVYPESNGSFTIPDGETTNLPGELIKVPAKRLDTFLEELKIENVDFVRMDVEGYESHILEGMKNTIKFFKPMFQIEVHVTLLGKERTKKFLEDFQDNGYETKYYIPRDIDLPIIGTMNDVKFHTIDTLLEMLENDTISHFFNVCFKKKNN
jgi:FkbM family methyltransferase